MIRSIIFMNWFYLVATTLTPNQGDYILDDPRLSDIGTLVHYSIDFLLGIAGAVAVLFVFIGASQYIWGWDSETKQKGKTRIFGAVAGIIVVTLSFLIVNVVINQLPRLAR